MTKIYFKNKDNLKLAGILERPRVKTNTCIILCHGATVDKEEGGVFTELSSRLTKAGFSTFRFDFRGHGESEGKSIDMTINGQKRDLESALKFLTTSGYKQFGIVAASFSGIAVSSFVPPNQNKIKALIYWNSVLDTKSLLKRWLDGSERERLKTKGYVLRHKTRYGKKLIAEITKLAPAKELLKLRIPVIFIHGERDTTIPCRDAVKFAKMIGSKIEIIRGSKHGFHTKKHSEQAAKVAVEFFLENIK